MVIRLRKYIPVESLVVSLALAFGLFAAPSNAQDNQALALQLENPLSDLVRLPYQFDYDSGYRGDGGLNALFIELVVPFSFGENFRIVSETILPALLSDSNWPGDAKNDEGFGDVTQTFYFTPKSATPNGLIWGAGPVFRLPTATEDSLGSGQLAVGPAGALSVQNGGFTYGGSMSQLWTVAGDTERRNINMTTFQPFASYVTANATTFKLSSDAFYDWEEGGGLAVPITFEVKQMVNFFNQPIQLDAGARYWATSPERYADGWGWSIGVTFPFP